MRSMAARERSNKMKQPPCTDAWFQLTQRLTLKKAKKLKVESSASECKYTPNTIKNSMIGIGVKSETGKDVLERLLLAKKRR